MATRYWVGGTGAWDGTNLANWSAAAAVTFTASCSGTALTTTGSPLLAVGMKVFSNNNTSLGTISSGSGNSWVVSVGGTYASQAMTAATVGVSNPVGGTDDVIFNSTSSLVAYTVTVNVADQGCNALTINAPAAGVISFAGSFNILPYANVTIAASSVTSSTLRIKCSGTGTQVVTTNGVILSAFQFFGIGSTCSIGSDLSCAAFSVQDCNFNSNNYNITCTSFGFYYTGVARTITLGTTVLTSTNALGGTINLGHTYSLASSTMQFTAAAAKVLTWRGITLGTVINAGAGELFFSNFTVGTVGTISNSVAPCAFKFYSGVLTNVTNFNVSGTSGNLVTITASTAGSQAVLVKPSGVTASNYLSLQDSNVSGGAWYAGASSTNVSNNTGWSFTNAPSNGGLVFLL